MAAEPTFDVVHADGTSDLSVKITDEINRRIAAATSQKNGAKLTNQEKLAISDDVRRNYQLSGNTSRPLPVPPSLLSLAAGYIPRAALDVFSEGLTQSGDEVDTIDINNGGYTGIVHGVSDGSDVAGARVKAAAVAVGNEAKKALDAVTPALSNVKWIVGGVAVIAVVGLLAWRGR